MDTNSAPLLNCKIFDLHTCFIFFQHLVSFEFVKHLSLDFQRINMCFRKVINECDKVSCFTKRCCFHWLAHIGMHNLQLFWSPWCSIFGERRPLMFAFNASFTHSVMTFFSNSCHSLFYPTPRTYKVDIIFWDFVDKGLNAFESFELSFLVVN